MVLTDEKWLLFVIEQVLSNALKYTSSDEIRPPKAQGMGSPDGDTEKGCISIYIKGTELVVEDTGIGIAPEDLPRILSVDLPDITEESTRNLRESVCTCARRSYRN